MSGMGKEWTKMGRLIMRETMDKEAVRRSGGLGEVSPPRTGHGRKEMRKTKVTTESNHF